MISWHSFDLRSGRRGVSLVTQQRGTLQRIIGEPTDTQIAVSCALNGVARPGWDEATQEGRTMLVALDDDTEAIIWGGIVLRRVSNETEWVTLNVSTLEHYFDRRFVGDLGYIDTDQASIAAGLLGQLAVDGLNFTLDSPASGTILTRTYGDNEDKTVLSALTELKDVDGGIEFTVDLEWTDATHTKINRIVRVRNRIGSALAYPTQWTMPGCVKSFELIEDYTAEAGANDVLATSSGEGDIRPTSQHAVAADYIAAGWARFEMRFQPTTSVTDFTQLDAHAVSRLREVEGGLSTLSIVADLDQAPALNVDWWLGDDIEAQLTCPRFPEQVGPDGDLTAGYIHRLRVVGWEIDQDERTLTPMTREVA